MYMAVVMATARTLGEAEPLAQPGSGFAFLVQQHPAHPVVLALVPLPHPQHKQGTVTPLLTILWHWLPHGSTT